MFKFSDSYPECEHLMGRYIQKLKITSTTEDDTASRKRKEIDVALEDVPAFPQGESSGGTYFDYYHFHDYLSFFLDKYFNLYCQGQL